MVRRQLGTEDIPRTNPAEIYNSLKNNFTDSRVSRISILTILDFISVRSVSNKTNANFECQGI